MHVWSKLLAFALDPAKTGPGIQTDSMIGLR
jgi:hypothetical protein